MGDDSEFARLADPYRPEILAHCYRMLGSVHDAEDLVQDTYLRAWKAYDRFEGRSSLRAWLYRIATRACLTALERRGRRPLPADLAAPSGHPDRPLGPVAHDIAWLEPYPGGGRDDPAVLVSSQESIRLAFVAALQHLPARQRAVLILRDVLGWRAAEVAGLLDTSSTAVNSTLQRARRQLRAAAPVEEETTADVGDEASRDFVDRYVAAFERADIDGLVDILHEDVILEMPPNPEWYAGRADTLGFLENIAFRSHGGERVLPAVANGQPALGTYQRGEDGAYRGRVLQVLTVGSKGITRISAFVDPALFPRFGLPEKLPEGR